MKMLLMSCTAWLLSVTAYAQENALWMRYPAISPDGKTIAFGYKGDIYRVDANGGVAVPLTVHEAQDMMPVWSRDGKSIAFASDRYGNFDVFVMPAQGGTPVRLTSNSAQDYPYDFTPDNKKVLFGSGRTGPASSVRYHDARLFYNLYTVPVSGGRAVLLSAAGAEFARYNSKGDQLVFQDRKGLEDAMRKHHVSAVTRDIWTYDIAAKSYRQLSTYGGEDLNPVFGNGNEVYFLSEQNGTSINVYKTSLTEKGQAQQLTRFDKHPVRHLSKAADNTLCFTYNGEVYTLKEGAEPQKVKITVLNNDRTNTVKNMPVNGNITEFAMSPNGKEIAFVARGEVFVSSTDGNMTKRITSTPQQERMVRWSPDGKHLVYAAERNGSWDIYQCSLARKEEPYFFAATVLKEEALIATAAEEFQPLYSPDGKEVAYLEDRNILKVFNLASGQSRTVLPKGHNHSSLDGDINFNWSPDSKWLVAEDQQGHFFPTNAALIPADGKGAIVYPVNSGFGETNPKWGMGGKVMTWCSIREGRRSWAAQGSKEADIFAVFLDQQTYDEYKLSRDEFALLRETNKQAEKDADKSKTKDTAASKDFHPDFKNLRNRRLRLTVNSASVGDYVLSEDGSKLYYMAAFESGYDLWMTEPRTGETRILAKLGGSPGSMALSKDGNTLFVSNRGGVVKVDAASGKVSPISINSEMQLDPAGERAYILDHAWKQVIGKFYDPTIRNMDWKMYHDNYARFLPHISNNYDFQELLSEMLGELNASHTGGRYRPQRPDGDNTASLGLLFDETWQQNGLKIDEVLAGGPFDRAFSKVKKGNIIEKVNGEIITDQFDWAILLNRKAAQPVLVSIFNPDTKARWDEVVKPIRADEENRLMYKRWVDRMRSMVDKLSDGKIGYVHVKDMNDEDYRNVFEELMGSCRDKEALIVDIRFNGGGWLHEDLRNLLSGKQYLEFAPQGEKVKGGETVQLWSRPHCVLINEADYSDAHIFPLIYKQEKMGKLIGMPVPGTGTAVWWEQQIDPTIIFGIPMIANIDRQGRIAENMQVEPDIKVPLRYEDFLSGKDDQLEAAVKEMLKTIQ
ncbi:S41 family peptidase [Chitinophaga flava]|uniref:Tricorn protease homolog n=1 Tax=Chitinophaga flava TaxID=2259036 RepID=A0A365XS29_9BACT|nr:S41 family peptidase [Chitinophaga flava]RBL88928.1 peptidase S41 [Chitinophaga flava]